MVNGVFTGNAICRKFEFNAYFQSQEESADATCFMPVAGVWLTNGEGKKKEAITSLLMTMALFCGCKLCPHLSLKTCLGG